MRLDRIKLVNVCQYEDEDVRLFPGLTVICGPNGVGKSNMVTMARLSVTNSFSSAEGVKEDNIRRGIADDELSYVETTWNVTEGEMVVRRVLQGGKSMLSLNGTVLIKGRENEITNKALELLNVSAATMNEFMFASQDALQTIISGQKSDRAAMFQSLCGLNKIDSLEKLLRDQISLDNGVASVHDVDKYARLTAQWRQLRPVRLSNRKVLKEIEQKLLPSFRVRELDKVIADHEAAVSARKSISQFKNQYDSLNEKVSELMLQSAKLDRTLEECTDIEKARKDKLDKLVAKDAELSRFPDREEIMGYEVTLLRQPPKPPDVDRPTEDQIDEINDRLSKIGLRVSDIQKHLDEPSVCSACERPFDNADDIEERHAALSVEMNTLMVEGAALSERKTELQKASRAWTAYDNTISTYNVDKRIAASKVEMYKQMPSYDDFMAGVDVESDLRKAKAEWQAADKNLRVAKETATNAKTEIAKLSASGETLQATINKLTADLEKVGKSSDNVKLARALLDENAAVQASYDEASSLYESSVAQLRGVLTALWAERNLAHKTKNVRRAIEQLTVLRSVLKRDRLPARIIAGMLTQTTTCMNAYLKSFGTPFVVEVDAKEFSFTAIHKDGSRETAARLSVGQKVALAISFWLARSSVFVGKLPFFCLDEPTAHLDEERVLQSVDVFAKLSDELVASGRQAIIITHHRALASIGNLIDLGEVNGRSKV